MKTKIIIFLLFSIVTSPFSFTQNRIVVEARNQEISDNLDLRAVASIFGDSRDLEDFERRLNDPNTQISNLDLNYNNQVDYLRVVEVVDRGAHLITIQAVLGKDLYQDVATIEVEKGKNNNVQIQVVGNAYLYGPNYIYEPVYIHRPVIYNVFWVRTYRPYYSPWHWGYHPPYYRTWSPYPPYRYRNHVSVYININNSYNYVNTRRSNRFVKLQNSYRRNDYERQYPDRSFSQRNNNITNKYYLDENRSSNLSNTSSIRRNINTNTPPTTESSTNPNRRNINTTNSSSIKTNNTTSKSSAPITGPISNTNRTNTNNNKR